MINIIIIVFNIALFGFAGYCFWLNYYNLKSSRYFSKSAEFFDKARGAFLCGDQEAVDEFVRKGNSYHSKGEQFHKKGKIFWIR